MDMSALLLEIEALRAEIATLKEPKKSKKSKKAERVPCPGLTGKGVQCKKYCVEGEGACKVHGRPAKVPTEVKKVVRVPKKVCEGLNMRGNPCKRKCVDGESWCERHDPSLPVKEKKGKSKAKKVIPMHNHKVGEEALVPCELCETHGDMFDEAVTEAEMVGEWGPIDEEKLVELMETFEVPETL